MLSSLCVDVDEVDLFEPSFQSNQQSQQLPPGGAEDFNASTEIVAILWVLV